MLFYCFSAFSHRHSFGCRTLTCQPWRVLRCGYPHGPQQPENKQNTLIMQDPADGVEPSQRALPGAGWGMGYLVSLAALHRRNNPCLNVIVISLS